MSLSIDFMQKKDGNEISNLKKDLRAKQINPQNFEPSMEVFSPFKKPLQTLGINIPNPDAEGVCPCCACCACACTSK